MRLAIFGLGLCGEALYARALELGWKAAGYSRSRGRGTGREFDAADDRDCLRLSQSSLAFDVAVTTFPPQNASASFWSLLRAIGERNVLLGSTSIYRRQGDRPRITEETPLKKDHARFEVERAFQDRGGLLVRLSGIYGGSRNPLRWIERGRVGYEDRQVNLVHYQDVAAAVCEVCAQDQGRRIYNLADGQVHTWRQIIDYLVERGWIRHPRAPTPLKKEDSFVENRRFLSDYPSFRFRDFWSELDQLAAIQASSLPKR